jgi:HK97 family phage prohead protease
MELERRSFGEVRTSGGRTLFGIAAPFNKVADIAGAFKEVIRPGAFSAVLSRRTDIAALADHRSNALLGRTRSGTLQLSESTDGLAYSLELPATSLGTDILELARRGDLAGVSIGFVATSEAWSRDQTTRELKAIDLYEISVISGGIPAYETTIGLRARGLATNGAAALRRLRLFLQLGGVT